MSAITGIFYRDGRKVDPKLIKKMNNRLSHRGPDGSAVWCDGPVALGHQMLWTTLESLHEKLPFEEGESGLVITADARIDNRKELSEELGIEDKEDVSDSYFILKAYSRWGENCPDKLLGDFAFVIWDKNEEKLFCARDHMGVKPFYYYSSNESFYFATEIKAILCILEVPYKLNELKIAFHLAAIREERELTFYGDILRLPAAHSLTIYQQKLNIKKYWELDPDLEIEMESDEAYVNKFLEIFTEAVNCRLRTQFPIGFELSGGLDSTSVTCVAKNILEKDEKYMPIRTFSTIFEDISECDESDFIKKIISLGGIKPHFSRGDQISPLNQIDSILWYQEQPSGSGLSLIWNLYKKMHANDIRVTLTGSGGDSVFSYGEKYFKELALSFQLKRLIQEIRGYSRRYNKSSFEVFRDKVIFQLIPEHIKKIWRKHNNIKTRDDFTFINKNFVKKLNLKECYREMEENTFLSATTSKKLHYALINSSVHQSSLESRSQNAATFLIEPRYPFYDKRLIEFCYAIPTEQRFKFGWNKLILRKAMKDILPSEIQWQRQKIILNAVIERNLLFFEKEHLEKSIYNDIKLIKDYVNQDYVQNMFERYKLGISQRESDDIFRIMILILWLQNKTH